MMKPTIVLPLLLPCFSRGAETISSVLSAPGNFRNISVDECSVNEMQCKSDEFEPHHLDNHKVDDDTIPQQEKEDYSAEPFGVIQKIDSVALSNFVTNWKAYMANVVMTDPAYAPVKNTCKNRHELCSYWSMIGECDRNPAYMKVNCAPACQSCSQIEFDTRCPFDANDGGAANNNAFGTAGDVDRFFERIVTDEEFAKYDITVHSRPKQPDDDETFPDGPWLITLEDFVSADEAERLIELGDEDGGYKRSTDVGGLKADGSYTKKVDSHRTSSNSWCLAKCMRDDVAQNVVNRMERVTRIPQKNSESLQLLRYEEGQYYRTHHDLIEHQIHRPPGARILTFYVYLNGYEDSGLEGGETSFPQLGVTVTPKRGRAAIWSSVLNGDPHRKDVRTEHAALPVVSGVKYGANAWIHQRDYITPNSMGCA